MASAVQCTRADPPSDRHDAAKPLSGALVGQPHRKLRVCVLHASLEGSTSVFSEVDPHAQPEAYDPDGLYDWSSAFLKKATSVSQLVDLVLGQPGRAGSGAGAHGESPRQPSSGPPDVYLNLCDGGWDEDRAGREVVEALERLNVPYTGADGAFYEPSKIDMKMAASYYGVRVPAWVHVQARGGRQGVEAGLSAVLAPPSRGGLRFPLIVKHPSGYGSVGMTKDSKVTNEQHLREQVARFVDGFGGALVEEFIEGREFTVLVVEERLAGGEDGAGADDVCSPPERRAWGPVAYTPVECAFGPGEDFKHFDLKWTDYDSLRWVPCQDPRLAQRLKDAACATFVATRGVSYGRCDFRVNAAGDIFLLEINPNCGVLYPPGLHGSADFILSLDPLHDHPHFLASILQSALHRHAQRQPKVAPAFCLGPAARQAQAQAGALAAGEPQHEDSEAFAQASGPDTPRAAAAAAAAQAVVAARAVLGGLEGAAAGDTCDSSSCAARSSRGSSAEPSGSSSPSAQSSRGGADACSSGLSAGGEAGVPPVEDPGSSAAAWRLVALVPLRAGEVVQRGEQQPHCLASRGFVERRWPPGSRQRQWFDAHAYPLNDQVLVTRGEDPTQWAPLTHSCDPNAWFSGLDVVARRDIEPGEPVTLDFATFRAGDSVAPFACRCGAANCRRRVTGLDCLAPWFGQAYGSHVSSFVAAKRREAGL